MSILIKWLLAALGVAEIESRRAAALSERMEAAQSKARAADKSLAAVDDLVRRMQDRKQ